MLLKSKVCFTVFSIYEMIAVTFLHFQRLCDSVFPTQFCDSWYRYFLFCVIVPLVAFLIGMWIHEMVRAHRRRRFIRRAKKTLNSVVSAVRGKISEHIDFDDMEKVITAGVIYGIKKYADAHPNLRRNINKIMDMASGEIDIDIMSTEDEVDVPAKRRTVKTQSKKTVSRKKK